MAQGLGPSTTSTRQTCTFSQPFAEHLGPEWGNSFNKVVDDLDLRCQPSAAVVWGRSVGALSLAMTMQIGAYGASRPNDYSRRRWLARVRLALSEMETWFTLGVISAHQDRTSDVYRSTARRLQLSLIYMARSCSQRQR